MESMHINELQSTLHNGCCRAQHAAPRKLARVENKYFEFKKLVGRQGTPKLKLLAVVIVLFAPILHETLTNMQLLVNCVELKTRTTHL